MQLLVSRTLVLSSLPVFSKGGDEIDVSQFRETQKIDKFAQFLEMFPKIF